MEGVLLLLDVAQEAVESSAHGVGLHFGDLEVHLGVIAVSLEGQHRRDVLDLLSQRFVDLLW